MHNISFRFVSKINHDIETGKTAFVSDEFVVKLNNSSGSHYCSYVKFAKGVNGIVEKITEFKNNDKVFGYIASVIVMARIPHNTQASVVCFDGKAIIRNPNKKGSDRSSPFQRAQDQVFFDFAEHVISELKRVCSFLMADQVLRVDFHGIRHPGQQGRITFLVNTIEGYETRVWGVGKGAVRSLERLNTSRRAYWYDAVDTLLECHFEMLRLKDHSNNI
jgi:hypothetical protein